MSIIYSPSTNDSLDLPQCFDSMIIGNIYAAFTLTDILLQLPLSVFVLSLGYKRWKRQRSASSAAPASLSDCITYNMAIMELIGISGLIIGCCGSYTRLPMMMWAGVAIAAFPWSAQMLFPILICVERYLAVVHPITYVRLRQKDGVRIRNISTGLVWLQCFAAMCFTLLVHHYPEYNLITNVSVLALFLITVTFCSLSVLCVLIRPRPGETGGDRARVDLSKRRAFHTIIIIMGVLWLRFGGNLVCNVLRSSPKVSSTGQCVATAAIWWFNLPSGLVLPLLFLQRAGKLPGCKHNTASG